MPDSVTPGNIPMGYPAYLGYVDGQWPTAPRLPVLFPGAKVVSLTVTGQTLAADGVDSEPGNVNAAKAAGWVKSKLENAPDSRPVVYADLETPGYGMPWVIAALLKLGIGRAQYRILTAHYTGQAHVCTPQSCQAGGQPIGFTADGTQWTDKFPGISGTPIDMSALNDDFFGEPAWTFGPVRGLAAHGGRTSVALAWSSPAVPAPEAVRQYQVTIRENGRDVPTYPRGVVKGGNPQMWQGGGLEPGTVYEALVRAMAVDGHAGPWATVSFSTSPG